MDTSKLGLNEYIPKYADFQLGNMTMDFDVGLVNLKSRIHLTGAATNPWMRFEFNQTLTQSKGGLKFHKKRIKASGEFCLNFSAVENFLLKERIWI